MSRQRKCAIYMIFLLILAGLPSHAQRQIRGIVRDSLTLEGLPYASLHIEGTDRSAVTDSRGLFETTVPGNARNLTASCQGYRSKTINIGKGRLDLYDIALTPQSTELDEVIIRKQKYTKKNNPAVEFARKLRRNAGLSDPKRNDYYSFDRYDRSAMGICDFDTTSSNRLMRSMPFLTEHVDSSEIDGKPVLKLLEKERSSSVFYRKSPESEKTVIHGTRANGIDEFIEQENTQTILDELLREVDLYSSNITLLRNSFVSPLSPLAPDFYRFYLVDSAAVIPPDDAKHIALAFYPRNKASFGFKGHIYVAKDDSTMAVRRLDMEVDDGINLNYIKSLKISQDFVKAPDGSRLKLSDDLVSTLNILPNTPDIYLSRKINFSGHSFSRPDSADVIFGRIGSEYIEPSADRRDSIFWESVRTIALPQGESRVELLMKRLRAKPLFYWGEQVLKVLERGYIPTSSKSRFDYGPVNTTVSYNSLEGIRLRAGGFTTANLSPRLFARGYVAYGCRDRKWKYEIEGEYSFTDKKYHPAEFPVHSVRLMHRYDVDRLGSHYLYTNADNFVLSLSRMSDNRFTYRRETEGTYTLELNNNFSVEAKVSHVREEASPFVRFRNGYGYDFTHYNETALSVKLRYAPGERFFQARSMRIPINHDAPVIELSHTWAPEAVGSAFTVNRTELSLSKDFRLSVLGLLRTFVSGGHIWSATPFPELFIPNANLSYTIQPRSFALMNPMEFINSSYASWHISWHLRGALFNLVPGLKTLHLREIVGFSGLYGSLSDKCNPAHNKSLFAFPEDAAVRKMNKPYMEISAGLDNILTILRIDYVWRLTYRDVPYAIDRSGVRVALHFTF